MTAEKNIRIKELIEKKRNEEEFNQENKMSKPQSNSQLSKF